MKLVFELAEAEGLDEAVAGLLEWFDSPEHMLSSAGAYILVKDGSRPDEDQFAWRITGLGTQI